ncbi:MULTISPECIES: saccharopine dehydrogenase family protein [Ramlibacter]|uniref:Saccharopine dehydrogenase n=1 Tax=Ramlibacter pinisoli TaxID=2682844 RepID=A0A6N8IU21_9BURK|nr:MULTISPECIES: saccharopine dehydrogenase NADP-binding domain-containing protein [Ramlibacter]MBA2964447.1 saccharopine dehydrogenase NADP-binding domain-containing protein [Ramlibacter sp. CGMCC 1.13660]MVQ29413.1 saccharopine dehydrogenase [Ramlibacter pinisoli]
MPEFRVLVLGGYGFFGRRLVKRLSRLSGSRIQVAGRSLAAAQALVQELQQGTRARLEAVTVDAQDPGLESTLRRLAPTVMVNASGPFQGADYRLPAACIRAGVHYADLADGRDYVTGIDGLHEAALAAGVTVTSGASSVPALSGAAVDFLAKDLSCVQAIDVGISPGNRTERGLSTVRGILTYCGKPLPAGGSAKVFGWTGARRRAYPSPVGTRLLSPCDVPDLTLFPLRYSGAPEVRFGAGLELEFLHRGMNLLAWMARRGLVRDWSRHATLLKRAADLFKTWGSDAGAMHVQVQGLDRTGSKVTRTWQLVATEGHGPFVPTLAAAAFVRKIQAGALQPGASACVGILDLEDFMREMQGLAIRTEGFA